LAKRSFGWAEDAKFLVPDGVREHFNARIGRRGHELRANWSALMEKYRAKYPDLAGQFEHIQNDELPDGWDTDLPSFAADSKGLASRESSAKVLNAIALRYPWLLGGAADLAPSTKTRLTFEAAGDFEAQKYGGRNFHFGIREHAMGAILNGLALSNIRAYGSSFLIFSDYMKPAIRLGALMELPVIYVFTHDSIDLGQDGPTYQPVEQLIALRTIPGHRAIFEFSNQPNETALKGGEVLETLSVSVFMNSAGRSDAPARCLVGAGFDSGNRGRRFGIS
jgi:transketolase